MDVNSLLPLPWEVLGPRLDEVLDLDPAARKAWLDELEASEPSVAAALHRLLAEGQMAEEEGFLATPAAAGLASGDLSGQRVGAWVIERLIGRGGMGEVWLAARCDGRYQGRVAIKFLDASFGSAKLTERFRREGQLLSRLAHPHIARLLDAGATEQGRAYLMLEYIDGARIDAYCEPLSIRERVRLFADVVAAVAHAHSQLVVHRDIKPSNVLVTRDGQVKLLDFGIAKLVSTGAGGEVDQTRLEDVMLTPEYAAPEQLLGEPPTTATDVYQLGLLLYVLLAGRLPLECGESRAERIQAALKGTVPLASELAEPALKKHLRGDLDAILSTALRGDPAARYVTALAFREDLLRYLNKEPVQARRGASWYRLRKFIDRHRLEVAVSGAAVTGLIIAIGYALFQGHEAAIQRDRALAMSARNASVVNFFSDMLTEAAPNDEPIRVPELLDRSQQLLLGSYVDPEHQAAVLSLLAEYYLTAGDPARARPLLDRAARLVAAGNDEALTAQLTCINAYALSLENRRDEALDMMARGLALSRMEPLAEVQCEQKRAFIAQNSNDAAGALEHVLAAQAALRRARTANPQLEAGILGDIAYAHYLGGHTAEADRYYQQALDLYGQIGRAESPSTFTLRNNWGIASYAAGDNRRALENYDEALRIARQRAPTAVPPVYLLTNRALTLVSLGRYPEALQAFELAIDAARKANNVPTQLTSLVNRAGTWLNMGDAPRAARELAAVEAQFGSVIPPDSVPAVSIRYLKGRLALARGELTQALAEFSATIDFFDQRGMAVAPVTRALNFRAQVHARRGDIAAARVDIRRSLEICHKLQDAKPYSSLTGAALLQLAEVEAATKNAQVARGTASKAFDHLSATLGATHPDALRAQELAQQ